MDMFHFLLIQDMAAKYKTTVYTLKHSRQKRKFLKKARAELAYKLRETGMEWSEIAAILSTSPGRIHHEVTWFATMSKLPSLTRKYR